MSLLADEAQDRQNTSKTLDKEINLHIQLKYWKTICPSTYILFYLKITFWAPCGCNKMVLRVTQTVKLIHIDRCIVKMGPLLQLYANRGHTLTGKFINIEMSYLCKASCDHSSNDAGDQSHHQHLRPDCFIILVILMFNTGTSLWNQVSQSFISGDVILVL